MTLFTALSLLAVVTAITCSLPGTFLVVRHQSMLVEAMSHAVFPGIVIGALLSGSAHSPVMVVLATAMGMLIVVGAEKARESGLVTEDASQGIIFPVLFAVGIVLLSTRLSSVHLSEAAVLSGELNLLALPSERWVIGTLDLGPQAMWMLLVVLLVDALFIAAAYRVLVVSAFDPNLARTLGLPARLVNLVLMVLVSLTVVVAFSTVGAILVVALMIVPPATARLLTHRIGTMIATSLVISATTALAGLWLAYLGDLATAPMMAFTDGAVFLLALLGKRLCQRRGSEAVVPQEVVSAHRKPATVPCPAGQG
ncbi:MAG: metal ABC transporter permease [Actinomycetia bacterium]|nr:metal ABC transporter permease [Actinomycetes bacterium]